MVGNSACNEVTTDWAEAAEMSKMQIFVDCAAKNRTIASPIPDAPPRDVSCGLERWGQRETCDDDALSTKI